MRLSGVVKQGYAVLYGKSQMKLSPLNTYSKTSNKLYILLNSHQKLVVKCYCGPRAYDRCDQERFTLTHWGKAGFLVPQIHTMLIPELQEPYLLTNYIPGDSLRQYLSSPSITLDKKLLTLERFFADMCSRHEQVIKDKDRHLVHYDPSSSNVILADNKFCHIDFEAPPKRRSALAAASVEVGVICRRIVDDIGPGHIREVLQLVVSAYTNQRTLLRRTIKRTMNRSLQFTHYWKDRRRKLAQANA